MRKNKKKSTNFCLGTEERKRKTQKTCFDTILKTEREKIELLNQFFDRMKK